jgi:hypothetical protein
MTFTLTTPTGKVMWFYLQAMAELYQEIYQGTITKTSA